MAQGKGEIKGWITRNGVHIPIYGEYTAEQNEPKNAKTSVKEKDAWRRKDPKFQKKTEGGVYFYNNPNSIYGKVIDEKMYDKLPGYIKKSVVMIEARNTADGNHCKIYYVDKDGKIQWFDEYGISDFMYELKSGNKEDFGVVSDWKYDGSYKEGKQLESRSGKNTEPSKKIDTHSELRSSIEKDIKSKMENYWKGSEHKDSFVKTDVKRTMERVDAMLDEFKDKPFIEPSKESGRAIVWRFSGKDKQTGKHAGFEFDCYPRESDARDVLRGNGYTVSEGLILPKPMFNYLMDHTNVTESDISAAKSVMKAALKQYKSDNDIRRGKK